MEIFESKEKILSELTKIINSYQNNEIKTSETIKNKTNDINLVNQMNQKLLKEIEEKDKELIINNKKCYDYEIMINQIQDQANKELDEKTKYDMIRAKDTEIHNKEKEIQQLKKKISELEKKNSEKVKQEDVSERWKLEPKNSIFEDDEKVKLAIKAYSIHTNLEKTCEEVAMTSLGLNGWYQEMLNNKEKTLVEKMKDITKQQTVENEIQNPVITEVIEDVSEDITTGETTEELSDVEEVEEKSDENKEKEKVKVDEEESEEEEEITVTTIKHYGKQYYIIDGEDPQYMYAIEDGELGEVKGEVKDGKKTLYKK